jgi:serine/threonine protein kinase
MLPATAPDQFAEIKRLFLEADGEPSIDCNRILAECNDSFIRQEVMRLLGRRKQAGAFLLQRSSNPSQTPLAASRFTGNQRFEVRSMLGSGGFGDVFECFDRELGETVAVKTLRNVSPSGIESFKREFRMLASVHHPNLARLLHLGFDPDHKVWFFSMELVNGVGFVDYLKSNTDRFTDAFRILARQLSNGVEALHRRQIAHRDIKPSNVLVTPGERLVILDFGLVARLDVIGSSSGPAAGTPAYMAPEQLSPQSNPESADWYSVATILYEALSGRLPFAGAGLELVERKTRERAGPFASIAGLEPYCELCNLILQPEVGARPSSSEIVAVLASEGSLPGRSRVEAQPLIGRKDELRRLNQSLLGTKAGKPAVILLSGGSGIGKTALARMFIETVQTVDRSALAFAGKCNERESIPYKAFDQIAEALSAHLLRLTPLDADSLLPDDFVLLGEIFPVFEPLIARLRFRQAGPEVLDPRGRRQRAFRALRELLSALARRGPVVIFIDDVQWIDSDSIALFSELVPQVNAPTLLFILATRPGVSQAVEKVRGLFPKVSEIQFESIDLDPLNAEDALQFASLVCRNHADIGQIAREAKGSPFLIQQLAETPTGSEDRASPKTLLEIVRTRAAMLPENVRGMLTMVAVAGAPVPVSAIADAIGLETDPHDVLTQLLDESWIRQSGPNGERCEPHHDSFREAITAALSPDELKNCHARLAHALERASGEPEQVSIHFREAGDIGKAARYARTAADRAAAALAFDRAARLYQFAADCGAGEWMDGGRLYANLGEALVNAGRASMGARAFLSATVVEDPAERLQFRIRAMSELLKGGEVSEGVALLREFLDQTGLPYPVGLTQTIARLIWERVRCRIAERNPQKRPRTPSSVNDNTRLDVCWAAAVGSGMVNPLLTEVYTAIHYRLALRSGDPRRLALGLAAEGSRPAYANDGDLSKPRAMLARARQYAELCPSDPYVHGFIDAMGAVMEMLGGNWRASQAYAGRATTTFRNQCTGVSWETATSTSFLFTSRVLLGDWLQNATELPSLVQDAEERGDRYTAVNLHFLTSFYSSYLLTENPRPREAVELVDRLISSWPHGRFDVQCLYASNSKADLHLFDNNPKAAWAQVESTWADIRRSGLLRLNLLRTFTYAVRGRAALALCVHTGDRRLLRVVRECIRHLDRSNAQYAPGLALLLRAGVAKVERNSQGCLAFLQNAEKELQSCELIPWLAAARLGLAAIDPHSENAERARHAALEWMTAQNFRRPECLVNMFLPGGF